jgi:MFS superfamily sulfate permease-like transporter
MADSDRRALLPIAEWMAGYRPEWLRLDVIAGATTAAVVIPKAMAYATVAGLPVEVGLYTVFVPMLVYALVGRRACSASARHDDRDPHRHAARAGRAGRRSRRAAHRRGAT